ncbi:hypothetical protein BpHYR1_022592 [Brachionus plicatilis]|uniref:Uncharacterized protein n=1 Tax=Brachionus plicatilis TaxID=10195 RepID=A0A3M7T7H5_BRAPC|nr:hypothetical protein BpHYR1_022592 [Brachionus plicatilis]
MIYNQFRKFQKDKENFHFSTITKKLKSFYFEIPKFNLFDKKWLIERILMKSNMHIRTDIRIKFIK